MQATVIVKSVTAEGCAANPQASRARAQIVGYFFNDGTSSGPGDRTGDILAFIQKVRDTGTAGGAPARDVIEAVILRCPNATCLNPNPVPLAIREFTTRWTKGIADVLRLQWDPAGHRFHFAVNPGTVAEETATLSYTVSDANPPVGHFKHLSVVNTIAVASAPGGAADVRVI